MHLRVCMRWRKLYLIAGGRRASRGVSVIGHVLPFPILDPRIKFMTANSGTAAGAINKSLKAFICACVYRWLNLIARWFALGRAGPVSVMGNVAFRDRAEARIPDRRRP